MEIPALSFDEFAARYCERQVSTPQALRKKLQEQIALYKPDGWFMAECQVLDATCLGRLCILPYGANNTFKEIPQTPFSPRGLASDTSVAVYRLPLANFVTTAAN